MLVAIAIAVMALDGAARDYRVEIAEGARPRMSPEQVRDVVSEMVPGIPPRILAMKCIPGSALGMRSLPEGKPEEAYEPALVWIVQRAGEWILIDDSNGKLIGTVSGATALLKP